MLKITIDKKTEKERKRERKKEGEKEKEREKIRRIRKEDLFFFCFFFSKSRADSSLLGAISWGRVILVRYAREQFSLLNDIVVISPPCRSCARTLGPRAYVRIYDTSYLDVAPVRTCIPTHRVPHRGHVCTHARTNRRTDATHTRLYRRHVGVYSNDSSNRFEHRVGAALC